MKIQELIKEYKELSKSVNDKRAKYGKPYEDTLSYAASKVNLAVLECKITILTELFKNRWN